MKKLFNYALLAAALLIGVNVNAEDVAKIGEQTYSSIADAFAAVQDGETIEMIVPADLAATVKVDNQKEVTLDLAGNNISCPSARFEIENAKLNIIGKGTISGTGNGSQLVRVIGSASDVADYSILNVGKDVSLECTSGYCVMIPVTGTKYACGVKIYLNGYVYGFYGGVYVNGTVQDVTSTNLPEIWINSTAQIHGGAGSDGAGIYAAGYAIWHINGYVEGPCGVYAKSGIFDIGEGANVKSNYDGSYTQPTVNGSGFDGGAGSAIVLDSKKGYAGAMELTITGNAQITSGANGYAIDELKTDEAASKTDAVVIESGTITGNINTTAEVKEDVLLNGTITGGTFSDATIYEYMSSVDGVITPVDNGDGTTSYVVTTKPEGKTWGHDITTAVAGDYIELTTNYEESLTQDTTKAEYLVAKSNAKVTIPEGKTLVVGEIVLDKDAEITVEKGATLIVEGKKGIVANQATNIVLKSEEKDPAFFLLDPQVTSNKTPKAMLTFTANSWAESATEYEYQYFGAPFVGGAIESITPVTFIGKTSFLVWTKSGWQSAGTIDDGVSTMDYSKFNTSFGFYAMCAVTPREDSEIDYVFTGRLFGNTNPEMTVNYGYTALSNGFTGNMDGDAILGALENTVEANVWVPKTDENYELQWEARNGLRALTEINPMATFMVKNDNPSAEINLSYEDIVWKPATETKAPASAPKANNFAMATVCVNGCGLNDIITFAEDDKFSADFDNGYDAEKYENTSIRFYVNADKEYDIFATDNVNNTFVGLMTTKAGKYTISFEGVTGNFALVDTKTNARIEMSEGATYEFLAEAGEDAYRFMIVEAAKAPTNTPATKAAVKATKALINDQIVINNGERFFNMLGTDVK